MLTTDNTILLVIDVQSKLAQVMHQREQLFANLERMIKGVQVLELPIILTEQVPEKLGPTRSEIGELFNGDFSPVSKSSFSCCGNAQFMERFKALERQQVLLTGIEAHICVYQTSVDLINLGYEVQLVTDGVASRTPENRAIGINRIKEAGASLTSIETALFELLRVAEGPQFKQISKIVK